MKPLQYNSHTVLNRKTTTNQSGLSLIELLIAMFIGLFLLAGITSSYLSSKKTSIARDQYSILEDNGRIALEVLTNTLQHTGYTSASGTPLEDKFITAAVTSSSCSDGSQSVLNTGIIPVTADNNAGDSLGVIYLGDSNVFTDCSGAPLPATCQLNPGLPTDPAKIYSAFFLDASNLQCAGSRDASEQTIAEGIENMQILYGVDANADNQVDRYVNAPNVGTLWNNVINIQVAVLARSLIEVKDTAESESFTLLDTPITTPTDRYQRAVFSTTISLRNSLN